MKLRHVKHYSHKLSWANLSPTDVIDLKAHIGGLLLPDKEDHELARRFDIIMLNLKLAMLTSKDGGKYISRVSTIAQNLSKVNVPEVASNMPLLKELQTEAFWNKVHVKRLEEVRKSVRELMKYLESSPKEIVYTSMEDDIDLDSVEEVEVGYGKPFLQPYKQRVESYIRNNKHHTTINKLRSNEPITEAELVELERILFDGTERGTKEEYTIEYGEQPLGVFIRNIVGLDIQAANKAFSEFIDKGNLRADQITFIKNIISFLEKNGTLQKSMLFESPFTDINDNGLLGVFDDADAHKVISIVERINGNAMVG